MKFLCQSIQKLQPEQTDKQYENITFPHTQTVNIWCQWRQMTIGSWTIGSVSEIVMMESTIAHGNDETI